MYLLIGIGVSSFVIALTGALMPGPLLTATVGESVKHGPRAGPLLVVGHAFLEFVLVAALFLGLAPLLTDKRVTAVISLCGGAILIYLAIGMFRSMRTLTVETSSGGPSSLRSSGRLVTSGILLSLSNPYWTIWWATIGLAYVLQSRQFGVAGVIVFFLGHVAADFVWYSIVSLTIGKGRRFLSASLYKWLVGICAVLLLGFSAWFFIGGARTLTGY